MDQNITYNDVKRLNNGADKNGTLCHLIERQKGSFYL